MTKEKNNRIFFDKGPTLMITILALVGLIGLLYVFGRLLIFGRVATDCMYGDVLEVDTTSTRIPYKDIVEDKELYDILFINHNEGSYMIIGYDEKVYYINGNNMDDIFYCANEFATNGVGNTITLNGNYYVCNSTKIVELDINQYAIDKVLVYDYPLSTDKEYSMYFIHDNGVVDYYHANSEEGILEKNAFSDFNVLNITQKCINYENYICNKTEITLYTKNGDIKKITNFNFN